MLLLTDMQMDMIILKCDFPFFIACRMDELNFFAAITEQKLVHYFPIQSHTLYTKSSHFLWFNSPVTQAEEVNHKTLLFL